MVGVLDVSKDQNGLLEAQYVVVFKAKQVSPFSEHTYETNDVRYFAIDKLPQISGKNKIEDMKRMIKAAIDGEVIFD